MIVNCKVEKLEKSTVKLEIEVEGEKFEEGMQKSYIKNLKKFNIPGFRKGKAPRGMVERYYGEQVLYEDAINIVASEAYDLAIEQNSIEVVDRPEIDIVQIGVGQNFIFTAKVTVKPEITLGEYKGIEVKKVDVIITEDDVEKEIEKLREKNSRLVKAEGRPISNGDTVTIDYDGYIDDVRFEGGKAEGHNLVIGSGQFIPGFEEKLIGANEGDELDVEVKFPDEYHSAEVAGKPAVFKVKVHEIRTKELPVVDDEFAKDVSEFDSLAELTEDTRKKLLEKEEAKAKNEQENALLKVICDNASVEIPDVMVDHQIESLAKDFDMRLRYQGLDLEKYLMYTGSDINTFKESMRDRAKADVKTQLVIEKIGIDEAITPDQADIDVEIDRLAENYGDKSEEFKQHLKQDDIEYIISNLRAGKTIDFLVSNAKFI